MFVHGYRNPHKPSVYMSADKFAYNADRPLFKSVGFCFYLKNCADGSEVLGLALSPQNGTINDFLLRRKL